jgi:hypothetical protein
LHTNLSFSEASSKVYIKIGYTRSS